MDRTERLALARELVDALEREDEGAAERLLQSLDDPRSTRLLKSVGELTREVHLAFGGVVSDARLYELSRHAMPDARERLAYVIEKSEEAAHRTLGAVETLLPLADRLLQGAPGGSAEQAGLARFVDDARVAGERLKHGLTEILMAQEYQDLTGQVIRKTIEIVSQVEQKLVSLLVAQRDEPHAEAPGVSRTQAQGPAIRAEADVLSRQHDVDDLLAELGL
jgi:chemotaxis protein CheZ